MARKLASLVSSSSSSRWLSKMSGPGQKEVGAAGLEPRAEVIGDEEEEGLPDGATARKLIKEFETVTNTDEIMAQYQLQVRF